MCDWDNGGKEVSDALEKIAYANDRQIINARVKFPQRVMSKRGTVERSLTGDYAGAYIVLAWFNL